MFEATRDFARDERGATAIEYALIAGLIGLVIVGVLTTIGSELKSPFQDAAAALQ
jgi:pilus assembly protein Flp/PilA